MSVCACMGCPHPINCRCRCPECNKPDKSGLVFSFEDHKCVPVVPLSELEQAIAERDSAIVCERATRVVRDALSEEAATLRAFAAKCVRALGAVGKCDCAMPSNPGCNKCTRCAVLADHLATSLLAEAETKEDADARDDSAAQR